MSVFVREGSPGEAFARSVNGIAELTEVQRAMTLGNSEALARLREPAERAAVGYSLVSWTGPVPEDVIEQVAELYATLNDAPRDPDEAPEVWDAQRVRERVNALYPYYGRKVYSVAARHEASGDLVALTQVGVDPANLAWGHQMITAVTKKHRGHRLGLLLKIAMLELLATEEPGLERIETWNAQSNQHMIAVNEALGYTVLGPPATNWRLEVARLV
jgi:RimJ/RimL family protein N-acetyltransferase